MKKTLLLLLLFMVACGSSQSQVVETTTSTIKISTNRCIKVTNSLLTTLSEGDGFSLSKGYAVKSKDFENASFVSAEFVNSGSLGIDGEVATWLIAGELSNPSYIEGVGGFGEEYSSWGSNVVDKKGSSYDDGYSESRDCTKKDAQKTSAPESTSTTTDNYRKLQIAIFDDSVLNSYDFVYVDILSPISKMVEPDLEYGADDIDLPRMKIGEIGEFKLTFDNSLQSVTVCFQPTSQSKGDMGTIWIVLNDENIEIDGLAVQDIVIDRKTLEIEELSDSSKPNCNSTPSTTSTSTTTTSSTTTTTLPVSNISNEISNISSCPTNVGAGEEIIVILTVEPESEPIISIEYNYSVSVDGGYSESEVTSVILTSPEYQMPEDINGTYTYNFPNISLDQDFMVKNALDNYVSILKLTLTSASGVEFETLKCKTLVWNLNSPRYNP